MTLAAALFTSALSLGGCIEDTDVAPTSVDSTNTLGVASYKTERTSNDGNEVYTLRAYNLAGAEVASVRLTRGSIPDMPPINEAELASEILVTIGDATTRAVTYETQRYLLDAMSAEQQELLELAPVKEALAREANILVVPKPKTTIADGAERAYETNTCPASYMNTSPQAKQCCYGGNPGETGYPNDTRFVNPNGQVVVRYQNPYGTGCRSESNGSCAGASCYYGPNGFSRPVLYSGSGYANVTYNIIPIEFGNSWDTTCTHWFASSPQSSIYGNVIGTFPTGVGCPGGGTGAGEWDY